MFMGVRVPLSVRVEIGSIGFFARQAPWRNCQTVAGPCQAIFRFRGVRQDKVRGAVRQKSPRPLPFVCLRIACLRADTLKFLRPFFVKRSPLGPSFGPDKGRAEGGQKWLDDF